MDLMNKIPDKTPDTELTALKQLPLKVSCNPVELVFSCNLHIYSVLHRGIGKLDWVCRHCKMSLMDLKSDKTESITKHFQAQCSALFQFNHSKSKNQMKVILPLLTADAAAPFRSAAIIDNYSNKLKYHQLNSSYNAYYL